MPSGVYERTEEAKRNIGLAKKGIPSSKKGIKTGIIPKTAFKKGMIPWNKGKVGTFKHLEDAKKRIGAASKGNKYALGVKLSDDTKLKMSNSRRGEKHYNWQGGKTKKSTIIRHSYKYKMWRESVFERDNYTCVMCGSHSYAGNPVPLNADHIKSFANFPELRFEINNGRTLCVPCHKTTDNYSWKARWRELQNINKLETIEI